MINPHKTIFVSDVHLQADEPEITQQFLQLLDHCDQTVDAIYILGDLFEAWIGDDDLTPLHQEMIRALKRKTDHGLPIYFLSGNRDFLIGKKFLQATGCKPLIDETIITLYGTRILLMHGDALCTLDVEYMKARKLMHNCILQKLFLLLPLKFRQKLANNLRNKSEHYKKNISKEIMDVTQDEVIRVMQKHHVQFLIHGHTHRPAIHQFLLDNINVERIVLPAWHGKGAVLCWYQNGDRELKEINSV